MPARLGVALLTLALPLSAIKVGYNDNSPQMQRGPDGMPSGFVIDIVTEAARRARTPIEWVYLPRGASYEVFENRTIDIWPAGISTPERRQRLHVTRPWWKIDVLLLTRENVDGLVDLAGRRVGITSQAQSAVIAGLPDRIHPVLAESQFGLATQLCRGELDAIATDRLLVDRILLNRPKECAGVRLRMFGLPEAFVDLGLIARKDAGEAAEHLQNAIEGLARDGTTTTLALRYAAMSGASAGFVSLLMETQHRNRELRAAVLLAGCLLLASVVVVYMMARNVSRRKRVEADLRRTNADLEQFNWAVHHDLREPVRNISLLTELIEAEPRSGLTPDTAQRLQWIGEGARRLARLLESLGQYTDLWQDSAPQGVIQVQEALADAIANLRMDVGRSEAVVEIGPLPKVRYSYGQLVQIFQNLISNAIKYRGEQPLRIWIDARQDRKEHVITVKDNGIGIPEQHRDRIFRMFKRLHGAEIQGTGIGLAICRHIVERNGGRIWVDEPKEGGACFSFTIPVEGAWRREAVISGSKGSGSGTLGQ